MKVRLIVYLFLQLSVQFCFAIEKPNSTEVKFARQFAKDFLIHKGADVQQFHLALEEYTDRLFFFDDHHNHIFLLMARDDYASMLNEQVLAFSIGVRHSKASKNFSFMRLYNYYDQLIKDISEGKVPKEEPSDVEPFALRPMLFNIRWTQYSMKDVYEGQAKKMKSGCVPVAVGQLMKFYEWPKVVNGDFSYRDIHGELRSIQMDGSRIDWNSINDIYGAFSTDSATLSPLMKRVGMSLKANYGCNQTPCNMKYVKRALTMNFGYSPFMYAVSKFDVGEAQMISLIRKNLKSGIPTLVSGGQHAFVCDGMYEEFLHLNMGWGGSFDGWYRFPVVRKEINPNSFFDLALLNIVPTVNKRISKTVDVETPGTLDTLLSRNECQTITDLKLKGKINGADIRLLRRMSGSVDPENYGSWTGVLTSLDLEDVTIVKDTFSYRQLFENTVMKERSKTGTSDTVVSRPVLNTHCFQTQDRVIGIAMFKDCENLQQLILPRNTLYIGIDAFSGCRCLTHIAAIRRLTH